MDWQLPSKAAELLSNARETRDYRRDLIILARPPFCFTVFQFIKMTILSTVTIDQ